MTEHKQPYTKMPQYLPPGRYYLPRPPPNIARFPGMKLQDFTVYDGDTLTRMASILLLTSDTCPSCRKRIYAATEQAVEPQAERKDILVIDTISMRERQKMHAAVVQDYCQRIKDLCPKRQLGERYKQRLKALNDREANEEDYQRLLEEPRPSSYKCRKPLTATEATMDHLRRCEPG
jgi:hypothetical protein